VKWSLTGESLVSEADDAEHAASVVEQAVARAADTARIDGADVVMDKFSYARESQTVEDG
jgi:hypothetical protein